MKTKRWIRVVSLMMTLIFAGLGRLPVVADDAVLISESDGTGRPVASDVGVEEGSLKFSCTSAVLMEANTGAVLYTQNCEEALPPASVTKIMTLLLVMEAVDSGMVHLEDTVTVSANAASMGGSQVYLKEGEQMTLEDMLKSVVIASANDAAVALAEHIAGSVTSFVDKMNTKAAQLGMVNTRFENVTGLDDTAEQHLTSAYDIALMSRELIRHDTILKYSSIWMDTIRNGAFGLTNTNRLVRFYPGCTGLKTGSTSKAGFCVSVTAERDGMSLICVVMGAESRDERNAIATQLLDWGFANYTVYRCDSGEAEPLPITGAAVDSCPLSYSSFSCVLPRTEGNAVQTKFVLPQNISAPVQEGQEIGRLEFYTGEKQIGSIPVTVKCEILKIHFFEVFARVMAKFLMI